MIFDRIGGMNNTKPIRSSATLSGRSHSPSTARPDDDLAPYLRALSASNAGIVEVDPTEDPAAVHGLLLLAASALDIHLVTGWLGTECEVLAWCRWPHAPESGLRVLATVEGMRAYSR